LISSLDFCFFFLNSGNRCESICLSSFCHTLNPLNSPLENKLLFSQLNQK
jgi:hypothetical protein